MTRLVFQLLSIFPLVISVWGQSPLTLRQTNNGPVEGIERISSLGQRYYAFQGIPYAEAPITGTDPYSGQIVDRRFKVHECDSTEPNLTLIQVEQGWSNV